MRAVAGAACALAPALPCVAPAIAGADATSTRRAHVSSGVDAALAYDLAGAQVELAPASGTLTVAIELHAALPRPVPAADAAVTIALAAAAEPLPGDATGDRCRPVAAGPSAGDATVTVAATPPAGDAPEPAEPAEQAAASAPAGSAEQAARAERATASAPADPTPAELTATAAIAPDPLPRTLPVALSPDRRRLTATLVDPLLAGAAPTCLVVRAHGRSAGAPAEAPDGEELSAWFDGQRPPMPAPGTPSDPAPPTPPASRRDGAQPAPNPSPSEPPACPPRPPAGLTWGDFPRELAVGGSALVPVQARRGRDVRAVVASLTTFAHGRPLGPPVTVALPPRGHALQLHAPPQPGRLDARLTWEERRDGSTCSGSSRRFRIAVVAPRAPRLTVSASARRLTLTWGLPGRDCHALLPRGLRVRVEGVGQRRDYRVEQPCEGWEEPGAALPDVSARRAGARLLLSPLGEEPGLWRYRLSAVSGGRTLLRGDLLIEVAERDGAVVRTIRLRRGS